MKFLDLEIPPKIFPPFFSKKREKNATAGGRGARRGSVEASGRNNFVREHRDGTRRSPIEENGVEEEEEEEGRGALLRPGTVYYYPTCRACV